MANDNNEGLIEPRTKKERLAYLQGYANAIIDIDSKGIEFARVWLKELGEFEGFKL